MSRSDVRQQTAIKGAADGIKRLENARKSAQDVHLELEERTASLAAQIEYLMHLISNFVLRRDELLLAAEAHPQQSAQPAELVRTVERLRGNVQRSVEGLAEPYAAAVADEKKARSVLQRIEAAAERLAVAAENLRLAQMEEQSRQKLAALELSSIGQLQQMGKEKSTSATYVTRNGLNIASGDLDAQLRDVARLTYEAEALAELRRERLR